MEVILKENFPTLGYVGDRVAVRRGYARNFLIPRGIAVELSSGNARQLNHQVGVINARKSKLKREAESMSQRLAEVVLEFSLKTSASGKSFGSITAKDLDTALTAKGFTFDRRQVRLAETIRAAGDYTAHVKLHAEVLAPVAVKVNAEVVAAPAAAPTEKKGRRKRTKKGEAAPEGEEASAQESPPDDAA